MRDEETGSWWQQVSGESIQGAYKGQKLNSVFMDEVTFGVWKREHPTGRVLRPDERVSKNYEAANWEEEYEKLRVITPIDPNDKLKPRTLIAGIVVNKKAIAYPLPVLEKERLILNTIDTTPIFVILGEDKKSVRAFERSIENRELTFFIKTDSNNSGLQLLDSETGSTWNFSGKALSGALAGTQLKPIPVLKDYWFDWKIYHPDTGLYLMTK